jgi:murein DD-endopeptidase MepM/ murein hydrolase activator NlpD
VTRGEIIGYSGDTGWVGPYPHLHFGTYSNVGGKWDVYNIHTDWYRQSNEQEWLVRVPSYDPSIYYPDDVFTFPVNCDKAAQVKDELKALEPSKEEKRAAYHRRRNRLLCMSAGLNCDEMEADKNDQ